MKLIDYFEDISNTDDTNQKIVDYIKNFSPNILLIINKTNKLQGQDVLKVNLPKIINYFSNVFFQKLKPIIDKLPDNEKYIVIDYIKKFKETLDFLNNETKTFLQNLKFSSDQLSDENKKLLIEIFFCCFILYKIIKEIEQKTSKSLSNNNFFEDSSNILFSIFEKGDVFKKFIDEKSEDFFRKGLKLLKPYNKNKFHKEIKDDNKEYKEKVEKNKNTQQFYLKYIGKENNFNYLYLCEPPNKDGSFLITETTPYDLYFKEYDDSGSNINEFELINSSLNDKNNFLKKVKIENLEKIFNITNPEKLNKAEKIKLEGIDKIKVKLDDNKKIILKNYFPICNLTFI
jgi:hypothetical protein